MLDPLAVLNAVAAGILLGGFYAAVALGIAIAFGMLDIPNLSNTPGMAKEMREWSATGKAAKLLEPEEMVAPLLFVVSREADEVQGYRFDANTWVTGVSAAASAQRTGRKAGFELYPISDCFAA